MFAEVLEDLLTSPSVTEPLATGAGATETRFVASAPLYTYLPKRPAPNRFWSGAGPYAAASAQSRPRAAKAEPAAAASNAARADNAAPRTPPPTPRPTPRPTRTLTPTEFSALVTLVRFGAALDQSATARELRTAFRALAQRYHPDRHPHVTDAERTRLSRTFAEIASAYDCLLPALS